MRMTPATLLMIPKLCKRKLPIKVAVAPSKTNTTVKPLMNMSAPIITRSVVCCCRSPLRSSSIETPEMNEMYAGTKGKTQGEINEIKPAKSAAKYVILLSIVFDKVRNKKAND